MVPLPVLNDEPVNDLTTGAGGGLTDIVSNGSGQSVYILKTTVNSVDYLIVRFRIGGHATSSKGWSILFDMDNNLSGTGKNPGFEREIVLTTGNPILVRVNKFTSADPNTAVQLFSGTGDQYFQKSIAASNVQCKRKS